MTAILIPIITTFLTGLAALLLRYIEKKIMKLDAEKASKEITQAQLLSKNPEVQDKLTSAQSYLDNIKKNSNSSFAKKLAITLIICASWYSSHAQRIEVITGPAIGNDTTPLVFKIYNDAGTTKYLASLTVSIQSPFDQCDSGYQVTATTPVITDTAAYSATPPQALFSQNKIRYTFYFQQNHRLVCPAHSVTEIAKDTIISTNSPSPCGTFQIVFSNPQLNNFFSISTGPGNNPAYIQNWWQFFLTQQ